MQCFNSVKRGATVQSERTTDPSAEPMCKAEPGPHGQRRSSSPDASTRVRLLRTVSARGVSGRSKLSELAVHVPCPEPETVHQRAACERKHASPLQQARCKLGQQS